MTALAASNHRIRRLRRLSGRRSARSDEQAFIIEGPILVAEALAADAVVEGVYVDEADESAETAQLITAAEARMVPVHRVVGGVLGGITDTVTPRGVLAVTAMPSWSVDSVVAMAVAGARPLVVLVDVRDPGNVGTIIRAAEASGAAGILCSVGTADPWSPKVVRSSAGTILHVPVVAGLDPVSLFEALAERGVSSVATAVTSGIPYDEAHLAGSVALVMGNEAAGLDPDLLPRLDEVVTIPMHGRAESLNVAMAASVLCFEAARQRRQAADRSTPSDPINWTSISPDDKVNTP